MFKKHELVVLVKTEGVYRVLELPDPHMVMEHCMEPFYQYWLVGARERVVFCRPQSEMEDGRFVPVNPH